MILFSFFYKDLSIAIIKRDKSYKSARLFFWRERERERDRQTDRQRERDRERESDGQRGHQGVLNGCLLCSHVLAVLMADSLSPLLLALEKNNLTYYCCLQPLSGVES